MKHCCANCKNKFNLTKYDYTDGNCDHTKMEGFICMAFSDERDAIWMVGLDSGEEECECFVPMDT